MELYISTEVEFPSWFIDIENAHVGPKILVVVAKMSLLSPTWEGWFEFGTQLQSPSLRRKHEKQDGAQNDWAKLSDKPHVPHA